MIYGLVLFPLAPHIININAVIIFMEMEKLQVCPILIILEEIFLTLNFFLRKGEGKLLCCTQLLLLSQKIQRALVSLYQSSIKIG